MYIAEQLRELQHDVETLTKALSDLTELSERRAIDFERQINHITDDIRRINAN